ncbi:ThyX-like thymidylate synthase [Mycobacterium phage Alice]|uniref:ThyX-like thymidylate synthase n=2 Tax=Bixzunavirus alice TaxID=2006133 RepID=A0A411AZ93_9CAUD|nr:ThyX [Mycobacterium phage Alice]AEJ94341.1 ThyX-like thymidylate synthase [Mycobacterium phage Alice]ATN91367.1 ThyX-like thymidylate synthase [Mycobacterium phage Phox]QAX93392.1 ThyX-like thymidylate synthase [Mycobacterium phage Stubby]UEM46144.1 ThyX-like thymidylate synthase [Mycobacterium phage Pinkcreek]
MLDIQFTDEIVVEVLDSNFSDSRVCVAARTSTAGAGADDSERYGLINALMRDRHGTPFEHMNATFRVTAPIFVWREHHRHRSGWSYSEESGRYKQLDPVFYVPGETRPIAKVEGTRNMDYVLEKGTADQHALIANAMWATCSGAYRQYEAMLDAGIVREVARMVLPVNIMSTCIVTCNARSLMHFLSLRQRHDDARFPSKPQYEINLVANGYERLLAEEAPLVHRSYVENGRVAP